MSSISDLNILVILVYYQRPAMVKFALDSVKKQTYSNWSLAFIDDGSQDAGEPIAREILGDDPRVTYYRIDDSEHQKRNQGGSRHGEYMNKAIRELGADIVVILCDDDALVPTYLEGLNEYYNNNQDRQYSYCHVVPYNPHAEAPGEQCYGRSFWLNHVHPLQPSCAVDSTQVSYRTTCHLNTEIHYPTIATRSLDASMFAQLYEHFGLCHFNGLMGQFKGTFGDQLSHRGDHNAYAPMDTRVIL